VRADLERKKEKKRLKNEIRLRRCRLRWLVVAVLLMLGLGGGGYYAWSVRSSPLVGSPAPDLALSDQDGRTVRLADFRGKQEVALFFYMYAG